jgi:hypothetical protein
MISRQPISLQTLCLLRVQESGHRHCLPPRMQSWGIVRKCCYTDDHVTAAQYGHVSCIQRCEPITSWYSISCLMAAQNGHVDCLEYFRRRGMLFVVNVMASKAAANGHLNVLVYLKTLEPFASQSAWDASIVTSAASGAQLECLRYLVSSGGQVDESAADAAARFNLACLKYLIDDCQLRFSRHTLRVATVECKRFLYRRRHRRNDIFNYRLKY